MKTCKCCGAESPLYVVGGEMHCVSCIINARQELLAMVKAANHALFVVGKPSAVKAALAGSKDVIRRAEGRT